jgi:hypothetical protein
MLLLAFMHSVWLCLRACLLYEDLVAAEAMLGRINSAYLWMLLARLFVCVCLLIG